MAEPSSRDVHVDALLTTVSLGYKNPTYIADLIAPIVPVRKQSDIIPQYDQSHWFRNLAALRAPGTRSQRGGFTVDNTRTYYCARYSWGFDLIDEVRDNTDMPYDLDRDATMFVTDKLQMNREASFASRYFTTGIWTNDQIGAATGGDYVWFSDYANSDPLPVLTGYMDDVEARIAREPNTIVLGKQAWMTLKWHPDLMDTIKYTGTTTNPAMITTNAFAALLELPAGRVLIGRSIMTQSPEGTAESAVVYNRIWGKHILLLYVPAQASLFNPAAMYTFVWQRVANALQYIKRMRDEQAEIDVIEGNTYYDQRVTAARAGQFLSQAVE